MMTAVPSLVLQAQPRQLQWQQTVSLQRRHH